jgi:hypothetical protein
MTHRATAAPAAVAGASLVVIGLLAVGWVRDRPPPAFGTMPTASEDIGARTAVPLTVPAAEAIRTHPARLDDVVVPDRLAPVRVSVAAAGISAAVVPVGVDPSGTAMAIPPDGAVVAWYRDGPSPGEEGSAVLAGHVDYDGQRGALFHLDAVQPGSEVIVDFEDGSSRLFVVVALSRFQKAQLPTVELFRQEGEPALALVTCGGSYDRRTRTYRENVVVFAVPAGRGPRPPQ